MFVKKCYSCKSSAVNILKSCNNWKTLHQFCSKCGKDQTRHILRRKTLKTPPTRTKHPKPIIRGSIAFILLFWAISALAFEPAVVTYQSQLEDIKVQATAIKVQLTELTEQQRKIEIIKTVAEANNIKPEHLVALAIGESDIDADAIGDNGCSVSYYQRNLCAGWTSEGIGDLEKESEFTSNLLNSYGYQDNPTLSFAKYNAPARPNMKYANYIKSKIPQAKKLLENL